MGIQQLQILSPYREKGEASSQNLNESIREEVNPELDGKPEVARGSRKFRLYDRVIQLKTIVRWFCITARATSLEKAYSTAM